MSDMTTTTLAFLALSSLLAATVAIGWLVRVSKRLSALGRSVLESEDTGKIIEAADKTAFFESRLAGCEDRSNQSQNQLTEHETKLGELAANLGATERMVKRNGTGFAEVSEKMVSFESRMAGCENRIEQSENRLSEHETKANELATKLEATERVANGNGTDLAEASEKMVSFESRMAGCENRTEQSENKLSEHETKVNELATKLEAVEQMLGEHAAGLAEANGSMKVLADGIQSLEEFQTATEKTRTLILAAFNDMRASMPPEECLGTRVDTAEPEETSQGPEEGRVEVESQMDRYPSPTCVGMNRISSRPSG